MRIGEVIGTVTLNRLHPSLKGGRFKLVVNSIIFGIPEEAVKDAADEAIRETSALFDLVQERVGLSIE